MANGGKRPGAGRPKEGRVWIEIGLTKEELAKLDADRGTVSRGKHLGDMLIPKPKKPVGLERFRLLRKP